MNLCPCKDSEGNRCTNERGEGLQCGLDSCARWRNPGSQTSSGVKVNSNGASVGGVRGESEPGVITLPWEVLVSVNQRQNPRSGFTLTKRYRQAKAKATELVEAQYHGPVLTGPLHVRLDLFPPDRRRRDVDAYAKLILDSLEGGGVMHDDSQVADLRIRKLNISKVRARCEVCVEAMGEVAA